MNSQPRVESTLELLDGLKGVVCEFTLRESKLDQDFRVKLASVRRRRDEGSELLTTRLADEIGQVEAGVAETKAAVRSRYARRSTRILSAHKTSKKKAMQGVDDREGGRKHKLQTETLQTKRNHETGLANAETELADFKAALAVEQESLATLEAKAAAAFKGFKSFVRLIGGPEPVPEPDLAPEERQLMATLHELLEKTAADIRRFRKKPLPALFRYTAVWVVLVFCLPAIVPLLQHFGKNTFGYPHAVASAVGCLIAGVFLHQWGKRQCAPDARKIAASLRKARRLHDVCLEKCERRHAQELQRVENDFHAMNEWIGQEWTRAIEEAEADRAALPGRIDQKAARTSARNEEQYRWILEHREKERTESIAGLTAEAESKRQELAKTCAEKESLLTAENAQQWQLMEAEWKTRVQPYYDSIGAANAEADQRFPPWDPPLWANWSPPAQFGNAAKFARLDVDVEKLAEKLPKDPRLALPGPVRLHVPLLLSYPHQGSVLFETTNTGREDAAQALNNIVLRLLSTAPAGRLSFTVIDPVGLGQSFSGVMHLADHAEHLINGRIWTQPAQIEQRLADLNEHMEKVIQMYLRNEYATIAEYNEQAGNIAEKYHFVVVADFPSGFTDAAARRLLSIAASGARCGVFTLIHWDRRQPMPQDFVPEELRKSSVGVTSSKGSEWILTGKFLPGTTLRLDAPPAPEFAIEFIHKVGLRSKDSNRVEVPFEQIAPADNERWSLDTTSELNVPIGRTGATKLQYLSIGKGTRQHALLAGKTGSGKSTLFHVMITNLALWCSPDQVEFYLIDFKKGVEFKCYASNRLPHARVVAIESDREFGLSVLQRLDDELKRRGDMFRALGVQDIAGYKRAGGKESIPRSLLIIDEFQEFFVEDDKIAQTASLLFDRIVRQGRAFGIHVLLGSQTLGGAYTVARTTLGQMVIRIALQCNEADAYLIMDDNNPAPRLLSRPGEGIYNDTAGTVEGNSPFQVVWLPDQVRDGYLHEVRERADRDGRRFPGPIVFEGNAPTDVGENSVLQGLLEAGSIAPAPAPRIWLGAPNSIKGPTEAIFHRQSGNNLLIVGQREEASLAILAVALISLAAQHAVGGARIILCDGSPPGTPPREYLEKIVRAIPHPITAARPGDLPGIMKGLDEEMARRAEDPNVAEAPPVFVIIHGLQKFNKLRHEEDFGFSGGDAEAAPNPAALLNKLICEGTRLGFHVIVTCDTFNNVNRFLSRKAFSEFEVRVLFQMSANDSASLIDSPKASTLGLHRALFYNEQEGYLETFRPYALPSAEWIDQAATNLARLAVRHPS
ncbi:MAG: segregation ATPase FtsK/SpoIIIE, family [Verrucomicrobiota bacterium]